MRNLRSKGLSIDSFLCELVSAKKRSYVYSVLTAQNKFAQARTRKTEHARPLKIRGKKIETHSLLKLTQTQRDTRLEKGLATAFDRGT